MRWTYIIIGFLFSCICSAQVIENPVFDRTDVFQFHIDKIEQTKDSTYLYCTYHTYYGSSINISPEIYLEDVPTGKKFFLLRLNNLPFPLDFKHFSQPEKLRILMVFQSISNSNVLNLVGISKERKDNIYGICLTEGVDTIYNNLSIEKAGTLSSWAKYYASTKDFKLAIEKETQAMNINKKWFGRMSRYYEYSVSMLGFYNFMIGNYDDAITYIKEDLRIIKELVGEEYFGYSITISALASCYHRKGKILDAIRLYHRALELAHIYKIEEPHIARMLLSTAYTYYDLGDYPNAIKLAEEALKIKKAYPGEDDLGYSPTLSLLSQLYKFTNPMKAYEYQLECYNFSLNKFGFDHLSTIKALSDLGIACANINKYEDALKYTEDALDLLRKKSDNDNVVIGLAMMNCGQIYENLLTESMYEMAIRYYLQSINHFEGKSYHIANAYGKLARAYAKCSKYEKAIHYSKKAVEIYKNTDISEMNNMNYSQKYLYWKNFHLLFDSEIPYYVSKLKNNQAVSELYDLVLYKKNILTNGNYIKESWKSIRDSLDTKSIAIEFLSFFNQQSKKTEIFALTIKKGYDFPNMTKLFNLSKFKDIMESSLPENEKNQLYSELLWEPIRGEIESAENIFFSATNILHTIGIEYLPVNNRNNCSIFRVSTTGLVPQIKKRKRYNNSVLFGGLDYDSIVQEDDSVFTRIRSGFSHLDNTFNEVTEIANLMTKNNINTKVFTGKEGTEKQLKKLNNQDIDILHLSTHGMNIGAQDVKRMKEDNIFLFLQEDQDKNFFYVESALSRSFMVLSGGNQLARRAITDSIEDDGIITALEISALDFHNVDLVVLSACETAQGAYGDDDNIWGLQRAFKKAGAKTILMSLDKVDDEATRILMVEFYKNLMNGKTKHQSLRDAQKYLRSVDNGKYDDPKYWASFIMLDGLN